MKLLKILVAGSLLAGSVSYSQSKATANKYFNQLAYKKAAEAYTNIYNRGNETYEVVSRIADSYYFNANTVEAEKWYEKLSEICTGKLTEEHLFRYAHTLKGNNNYPKANSTVEQITSVASNSVFPKELAANPNYSVEFSENKYKLNNFNNLSSNTKYSDFGAFVYNDKLYYASSRPSTGSNELYNWNEQPYLNLYNGGISTSSKGSNEEKVDVSSSDLLLPVRTKYHESNAVITKDGKTMYFTRDNYSNGKKRTSSERVMRLKLYRASLDNGKWKNVYELPFNNNEYSVGHPTLSKDEQTLYFVSDMPGGKGSTDIYKVSVNDHKTYGTPVNLGDNINTPGREMFPFISEDNTLYFSSDGLLGLGGLDVYESLVSEDGSYGVASNLQTPFNSPLDDFSFYIDLENKRGFVSSNREGGKGDDDIYSFVLSQPKKRADYDCKKVIEGVVVDAKSGAIIPEATVKIFDEEGMIIKEVKSDAKGAFNFPINCLSNQYKITGDKQDYRGDLQEVASESYTNGTVLKLNLEPLIVEKPVVVASTPSVSAPVVRQISIRPIYFNFDKSGIRSEDSEYELEHVVDVMKNHPDLVIKIESHTDARGSKAYNRGLSQRRANATRDYIISRGISSSRIASAKGYGESRLQNDCGDANLTKCSEEEHQYNRRSYFIIVSGGEDVSVQDTLPTYIDRKK